MFTNVFQYLSQNTSFAFEVFTDLLKCRPEQALTKLKFKWYHGKPIPKMLPSFSYKNIFLNACKTGDMNIMNTLEKMKVSCVTTDVNEGLHRACKNNQMTVGKFLLEKGATNLNECLKITCQEGFFGFSELLIQKGASVVAGLRVAKSPNIINMLYKYENGYKPDVLI